MPRRVQRQRKAGWRAPLDAQGRKPKYVGRGTRWGNPWAVVQTNTGGWVVVWRGPGHPPARPRVTVREHAVREQAHAEAVDRYHDHLDAHPELVEAARRELAGRDLMCWCPLPEPGQPDHCHAAVLLELAAQPG